MDSAPTVWYYAKRGDPARQQIGPLTGEQFSALAQAGTLTPDDLVWNSQLPEWVPAAQVPGLFPTAAPPVVYPAAYLDAARPVAVHSIGRRRSRLYWAVPLVVLILVGGGLGAYFGFLRGGEGGGSTVSSSTGALAVETTIATAISTTTIPPTTSSIETTTTQAVTTTTQATTTTTEATTTTEEVTTTTEATTLKKWNTAAEVGGLRITVSAPVRDDNQHVENASGEVVDTYKVLIAKVVLENLTSEPHSYAASSFELTDTDGSTYWGDDEDAVSYTNHTAMRSGYLDPGKKITRWLMFIVPSPAAGESIWYFGGAGDGWGY